jgi:acetolactate synthase-1/2/3 large subunit
VSGSSVFLDALLEAGVRYLFANLGSDHSGIVEALAGAVHNVAKGRVPVLIFAGASPFSQNGELPGGRNEFIHWIQDVHDQRGLIRGYTKYDYELRSADQIREITHRALRFSYSEPQGPVYLMATREVLEAPTRPRTDPQTCWQPVAPCTWFG